MITPEQCRVARGLLGWNLENLAYKAAVSIVTVHKFEAAAHSPPRATIRFIQRAFEGAGIEFIDENGGGPGVRLRKRQQRKE
jgi:predicted transcriptional regulator